MRSARSRRRSEPPLWLSRLRWRLRGDSARIGFVLAVVVDTALLAVLPAPAAGQGAGRLLLLAVAGNVVLVAVGGAVGSWALRRRDASLPRIVARDRAATLAMVAGTVAVCAVGLLHEPEEDGRDRRREQVVLAAERLAVRRAPAFTKARLRESDVLPLTGDVYRVCFPARRAGRAWCTFVRRRGEGYRARRDSDPRPNASADALAGPRPTVLPEP
ncbi:hypothetical protein [Patulibacter sp. SYSU D01012]|uniref:hypothetical protein n=1 Tax=Patulibacter sp. SYSU D01012 TaxID=2817381 RepID=UPI001B301507|nr:hypothetical protein [Patulibacter sp. SYSU D01012]